MNRPDESRIEGILQALKLDRAEGFRKGTLVAEREGPVGEEEVWKRLEKLVQETGWLCLSSEVIRCPNTDSLPADRTGTWPLEGEWVFEDGTSSRLCHLGSGKWEFWKIGRDDKGDGLIQLRTFLSRDEKNSLCYEVCWKLVDDGFGNMIYRPRLSRFTGFAGGKGEG